MEEKKEKSLDPFMETSGEDEGTHRIITPISIPLPAQGLDSDQLNILKEEVKLLVGEVENQRSFIEKLKERLKSVEGSKNNLDEQNQFLQKNLQRLIKEKVSLLEKVESLHSSAEATKQAEASASKTDKPQEGRKTDRVEKVTKPTEVAKNPGVLQNMEAFWTNLKKEVEGQIQQYKNKTHELENSLEEKKTAIFKLQEELQKIKWEKGELQNKNEKIEQLFSKIQSNYSRLLQEMDEILLGNPGLFHGVFSGKEKGSLSLFPQDLNKKGILPSEKSIYFPSEKATNSAGEETRIFSTDAYLNFLIHFLPKKKEIIQPRPDPQSAIGYVYSDVIEWGGIPRGEEASFLEKGIEKNYFTKKIFDKVYLCPHCFRYNIHSRNCCVGCYSVDLEIEHEKSVLHYSCKSCGKNSKEVKVESQCLNCGAAFPFKGAILCNLYQYEMTAQAKKVTPLSEASPKSNPPSA